MATRNRDIVALRSLRGSWERALSARGARLAEIAGLKVTDLDLDRNNTALVMGKGRLPRAIAFEALARRLEDPEMLRVYGRSGAAQRTREAGSDGRGWESADG